jgi:hypothetical protein
MSWLDRDHYLESPEGQLAQYRRRQKSRIWIRVDDIEPRSKQSMPQADKDEFQRRVLQSLTRLRRQAFRGPIALELNACTTETNPSHAQTIAKNILDLLAEPRPTVQTTRGGLIYYDDKQIQALSVSCSHGEERPEICLTASSLRPLLDDLLLALEASRDLAGC